MAANRVFFFLIPAFAGILSAVVCRGAEVSKPVGAALVTIPSGYVPVSPAFVHEDAFAGSVESVTVNGAFLTLTFPGSSFPGGGFAAAGQFTHYLEVAEPGSFEGMYFNILSNTENAISILLWEGEPVPIAANERVVIRKHMTIGDFFHEAKSQLRAGVDNIKLFYPEHYWRTIFWDGGKWTTNFLDDVSGAPVYPGQGFLATFSGERSFRVRGHVKTTPTQVPAYAGEINLVGSMSPLDRTFGELATAARIQPGVDSFKLYSSDGSFEHTGTYFSTGQHMTDDFTSDRDSVVLMAHAAYLLIPGEDMNWTQPPAYEVEP